MYRDFFNSVAAEAKQIVVPYRCAHEDLDGRPRPKLTWSTDEFAVFANALAGSPISSGLRECQLVDISALTLDMESASILSSALLKMPALKHVRFSSFARMSESADFKAAQFLMRELATRGIGVLSDSEADNARFTEVNVSSPSKSLDASGGSQMPEPGTQQSSSTASAVEQLTSGLCTLFHDSPWPRGRQLLEEATDPRRAAFLRYEGRRHVAEAFGISPMEFGHAAASPSRAQSQCTALDPAVLAEACGLLRLEEGQPPARTQKGRAERMLAIVGALGCACVASQPHGGDDVSQRILHGSVHLLAALARRRENSSGAEVQRIRKI
jgi:hypothetical protein